MKSLFLPSYSIVRSTGCVSAVNIILHKPWSGTTRMKISITPNCLFVRVRKILMKIDFRPLNSVLQKSQSTELPNLIRAYDVNMQKINAWDATSPPRAHHIQKIGNPSPHEIQPGRSWNPKVIGQRSIPTRPFRLRYLNRKSFLIYFLFFPGNGVCVSHCLRLHIFVNFPSFSLLASISS